MLATAAVELFRFGKENITNKGDIVLEEDTMDTMMDQAEATPTRTFSQLPIILHTYKSKARTEDLGKLLQIH